MSLGLGLLLIVAVLAGVGAWLYIKQQNKSSTASIDDNRYATEEAISPAHISLLMYLREAFPGRAVLFRPRMDQIISVRHSENRALATAQLAAHVVDFVVCAPDGKAEHVFDVRMRSANIDENQQRRETAFKTLVLKSVDLRLLRIQRSVSKLPPPEEFAAKLAESLGRARAPIASYCIKQDKGGSQAGGKPAATTTSPANLTDLMGLPPDSEPGKLNK